MRSMLSGPDSHYVAESPTGIELHNSAYSGR